LKNVIAAIKQSYHNYELHPQKQHICFYQEPTPSTIKVLDHNEQSESTICTIQHPPLLHPLPEPETRTMNAIALCKKPGVLQLHILIQLEYMLTEGQITPSQIIHPT
jgi:hypothetical protein